MSCDVLWAVRDWGNSLTQTLVGVGNPLVLGFHFNRLRSPGAKCYALLSTTDGGNDLTAEGVSDWASVSAVIYSATDKDAARVAALAYVDALRSISATRPLVPTRAAQLLMAGRVSGPDFLDDDEPAYVVTAEIHAVAL